MHRDPARSASPRLAKSAAGAGPAGMAWLGMISRMCRKAQRTLRGSCQLASVTRESSSGGKPVILSMRTL